MSIAELPLLGWWEWVTLPALKLSEVKAKIDTGARTSALHATDIQLVRGDRRRIRFRVPTESGTISCTADLVGERPVRSSNGQEQRRFVIMTPIRIGDSEWEIEVSLTDRTPMQYPMLLGRAALARRFTVDPSRQCLAGRRSVAR